eukprot:gnl/Chilomastix_cuspidata/735.p2 GENE.gnl/Chilomastix_cuspidata/735~~gnl/Chilomastix_cuspidata/735.p2  ORF type:complete len:633 (-),score=350.81 gnl/Chilomastix_cuspidata/735:3504-5402(-)
MKPKSPMDGSFSDYQKHVESLEDKLSRLRSLVDVERSKIARNKETIREYRQKRIDQFLRAGLKDDDVERQQETHDAISRIRASIEHVKRELQKSEQANAAREKATNALSKEIRYGKASLAALEEQSKKLSKEAGELRQALNHTRAERGRALEESKQLVERFSREKAQWMKEVRQFKEASPTAMAFPQVVAAPKNPHVLQLSRAPLSFTETGPGSSSMLSASHLSGVSSESQSQVGVAPNLFQALKSFSGGEQSRSRAGANLPPIPKTSPVKNALDLPPPAGADAGWFPKKLEDGLLQGLSPHLGPDSKEAFVRLANSLRDDLSRAADVNTGLLNFVNKLTKENQEFQEKILTLRGTINSLKTNTAHHSVSLRNAGKLLEERIAALNAQISRRGSHFRELCATSIAAYNQIVKIVNRFEGAAFACDAAAAPALGSLTHRSLSLSYNHPELNQQAAGGSCEVLLLAPFVPSAKLQFPHQEQFIDLIGSFECGVLDLASHFIARAPAHATAGMLPNLRAAIKNTYIAPARVGLHDAPMPRAASLIDDVSELFCAPAELEPVEAEASGSEEAELSQDETLRREAEKHLTDHIAQRAAVARRIDEDLAIDLDAANAVLAQINIDSSSSCPVDADDSG